MLLPSLEIKLNAIGQRLVERLVTDIKEKKVTKYGSVNSSGNLANSVRYEITESKLIVYADDYIYYLQFGRKPGKFPPKAPILEWVKRELNPTDISVDSLTFLIQRKIAQKGTTIYEQGGSDLVSKILEDEIPIIQKELADEFVKSITSEIISALT